MAHIQSKPVHDSEAQHKRRVQTINATDVDAGSAHRSPQKEGRQVNNATNRQPVEELSREFRIMGFPWQFVAVMGVIAGGVLLLVLKAIGLF